MVVISGPGAKAEAIWQVPVQFSAKFNLGAGLSIILPTGIYLIGIYCDHANFDDVRAEINIDGGWIETLIMATINRFKPETQTRPSMYLSGIPSDGANVRITNQNVAQTNNIIYMYQGE